jgi:cysteine desulfurase
MSVYLDWAATSPPDPVILAEMTDIARSGYGNPSSAHKTGKKAAELLAEARQRCASALKVKADTILFTSGGTESDYLPMLALIQRPVRGTIAVSAVEHPAILEQARMMDHTGWKTLVIPVNSDGFVTVEAVLSTIERDTAFVAVMAVNNETGAVQPIKEIAAALITHCAGRKKPHFHVDAVQAAGKIPLDLSVPGIDSAAVSGHKIGGPRGIGILYLARRIEPFIRGGGQESGQRPGTENLAGAWGISRALENSISALSDSPTAETMRYLISSLGELPSVSIIPSSRTEADSRFSPWIVQFTDTVLPGEVLVRALSDRDVFISMGSACSSKKKTRPVLEAMNIPGDKQQNAFRLSIGRTTTKADIDIFISELKSVFSAC